MGPDRGLDFSVVADLKAWVALHILARAAVKHLSKDTQGDERVALAAKLSAPILGDIMAMLNRFDTRGDMSPFKRHEHGDA